MFYFEGEKLFFFPGRYEKSFFRQKIGFFKRLQEEVFCFKKLFFGG